MKAAHPVSTPLLSRHELERELAKYRQIVDDFIAVDDDQVQDEITRDSAFHDVAKRARELRRDD